MHSRGEKKKEIEPYNNYTLFFVKRNKGIEQYKTSNFTSSNHNTNASQSENAFINELRKP